MKDKIIVRVMGGLGNQMFQYAWGRFVAHKSGVPLELDVTTFDEGYEARSYALDYFGITGPFASSDEVRRLRRRPFWMKRIGRYLFGVRTQLVRERKNHKFDRRMLRTVTPPALLDGYWQCAQYMEFARPVIASDFSFPVCVDSQNQKLLEQIKAEEAVAVHVRRGDYVSNAAFSAVHGVCSLEYYDRAIRYLHEHVDNPRFYIFSDDLDWAKRNLGVSSDSVFVDNNQDQPAEDLRLMAACKHNIIANSSFSWWGAFLGDQSGKRVIAPRKWYAQGRTSGDLLPYHWVRL